MYNADPSPQGNFMGESHGSSKKDYLKKPMVVNFGPGPDESLKPG